MAGTVTGDAIEIVEAAYDLTGDTRAWLTRLLECAGPRLDRGLGTGIASSTRRPHASTGRRS